MTELYLCELWAYLDARIDLLDDQGDRILRGHVSRMWTAHFYHEADHPNLFPTEHVREVYGTYLVPLHWSKALVTEDVL